MLEQLRAATASLHVEVEKLVDAEKMENGTFSIADYARYLLSSYHFQLNIEELLHMHAAAIPYSNERIKTPALQKDLMKLNITLGKYTAQLNGKSLAATMGYLYVSEGSMLGGQVIYKSLQKIPTIRDLDAFDFLTVYNTRTGALWSSFKEVLEKTDWNTNEQQTIVDAATEGFLFFREIYNEQTIELDN